LNPAIEYAEKGFPVFSHLQSVIRSSQKTLGADPAWANVFLPGGKLPDLGDLLVQSDLAGTLAQIASEGRDPFYSGEIVRSILRSSERHGGFFSAADFSKHQSRWEEPLHSDYRGYEICVPPPNSYGLLLLLQLKSLTEYDLARYGHNTPEYVRLQVKAKEEAWKAGQFWVRDPDHYRREDVLMMLEQYPDSRTKPRAVAASYPGSDTTYIAVADNSGNWASVIQSVHQSFGCGIVVEGTGIVLNNRMSGFNLIPGHPNEVGPAKRPAHTLSPVLILRGDRPVLAVGTPGGLGQTQFLTQILCNLFDFNMDLQEAVEAPRWQSEAEGRIELESRFTTDVSEFLRQQDYDVKIAGPWEFALGGAEAVFLHKNAKVLMGAADPRREGYALGY
jgi:gamma-glutamyltranspeptidase/glutathione hydrolase